jgi:hypothetical protein
VRRSGFDWTVSEFFFVNNPSPRNFVPTERLRLHAHTAQVFAGSSLCWRKSPTSWRGRELEQSKSFDQPARIASTHGMMRPFSSRPFPIMHEQRSASVFDLLGVGQGRNSKRDLTIVKMLGILRSSSSMRPPLRRFVVSKALLVAAAFTLKGTVRSITMSSTSPNKRMALIFCHGLGDTPAGWESLEMQLPMLQPRLASVEYIFPAAPTIPISINGGGKFCSSTECMAHHARVKESPVVKATTCLSRSNH